MRWIQQLADRPWFAGVLALAGVLLMLQGRVSPIHRAQAIDSTKPGSVAQALELLPLPTPSLASPSAPSSATAPAAASDAHLEPPTRRPEQAVAPFDTELATPIVRALAEAPTPVPAQHAQAPRPARTARTVMMGRAVPDEIEGASRPENLADPLAEASVSASLRLADDASAPFVLLESRTQAQPARARIGYGGEPTALPPSWLEVGDAPAPGWRIVRIDARSIDVLNPYGNPVRLQASRAGAPRSGADPYVLPRP